MSYTLKINKFKYYFPFIAIGILYLLTLKGMPGNLHPNGTGSNSIQINKTPFETSMERGRYAQVVSLVESGNLDVNEFYEFLKPDVAWYNNRFLSTFPPGMAIISAPLYLLGKMFNLSQVFVSLTPIILSLLVTYFIFLTCIKLGFSTRGSVFASLVYSLGSVAWAYSVSISAHPASALLLIMGAYYLLDILITSNNETKSIFAMGLLFGLCFLIDYPNILIFFPILVVSLFLRMIKSSSKKHETELEVDLKPLYVFFKAFLPVILIFVVFNLYYFQKPIAFTNTYSIKFIEVSGKSINDVTLSNDIFDKHDYSSRFTVKQTLSGVNTLLLSRDRGLLKFSPIYIMAVLGFILIYKKQKIWAATVLVSFILNVLVYGAYDDPWGGWAFGPRYLIVTLPLLAIFCGSSFDYLVSKFGTVSKIILFSLLMFSSFIALLGASTTNAVPPSIEVVNTSTQSNYLYNWNYLTTNGVSSFFHNILPLGLISSEFYFYFIFALVCVVEFLVTFYASDQVSLP